MPLLRYSHMVGHARHATNIITILLHITLRRHFTPLQPHTHTLKKRYYAIRIYSVVRITLLICCFSHIITIIDIDTILLLLLPYDIRDRRVATGVIMMAIH